MTPDGSKKLTRPTAAALVVLLLGSVLVGASTVGAFAQTENSPPSVNLGDDHTISTGETLVFEPTATDADGEVVGYAWRVDGTLVSREDTLNYTFRTPGEFEIEVTAFDDDGATATDTVLVTVNARPTASIDVTADGSTLDFSANATDPDGEIASYEWVIDGETVSSEESFSHTFETSGEHAVTLVVTDGDGAETSVSTSVQVQIPTATSGGGGLIPGFGLGIALVGIVIGAVIVRWRLE